MKNTLDHIVRRTQRYWYIDGLAEITVGLSFLVLGGYFALQARIKTVPLNPVVANLALLAAVLLILWGFRSALQAAKVRLTYPRTGYVANPRRQKALRWQRYGLTAWLVVVCISLFVLTLHSRSVPTWEPLLLGVVAGLTILVLSFRFRLVRLAILACVLVLIGALVSFFNPGATLAAVLSAAADGAGFIVSGGVTLVGYLRSTQPPTGADL